MDPETFLALLEQSPAWAEWVDKEQEGQWTPTHS